MLRDHPDRGIGSLHDPVHVGPRAQEQALAGQRI